MSETSEPLTASLLEKASRHNCQARVRLAAKAFLTCFSWLT